jgi:serine/threonine protein kinase
MPTQHSQSTVGSVTVLGKLGNTRGLSAFIVLLLLAPVLTVFSGLRAYERTQLPDVGMAVNDQLAIESVDPRWAGLEKGDQVIAIDGKPLADPADWVATALSRDGPMQMTVERDGRRYSATAAGTPMHAVDQIALWARVATGAALMIMGLMAFVLRPGVAVTWLMLLMAWDLGIFLLLKIGLYADPLLYKQAATYPFIFAMCVGLHFLSYFPQKLPWAVRQPRRAAWLYVPMLTSPFIHAASAETSMSTVGTAGGAVVTLLVTSIVAKQYRRVRHSKDAAALSKYRALLFGFVFGLVLPAIWNWLRISLGIGASTFAAHYNAIPLVLFVGVTSYAVVRHNALAIDRFTASVVGYTATMILLGSAFAGALLGIPLLLGKSGMADSPTLLVAVTGLTFASFAPLYRRVKAAVDQRFFRGRADAAEMADVLRDLVLTMPQSSRDNAVRSALEAANILRGDRAEVWVLSDDGKQLVHHRGSGTSTEAGIRVPLNGPLGHALATGVTAGVEGLAPRAMEGAAQDELWEKELAMAAPVMVYGVVAGMLCVGRKRSGGGFPLEELSFLSIIAAQLGSVLERSQAGGGKLDRYHLERRLGTGGMAEVFLAWQVGPGGFERKVALKRPLPHVSDDANTVAAFLDEARLAAQLHHGNIAQVYDVGESDGVYFIVMEYVDGPSLRQLLSASKAQGQRVPLSIAAALTRSVLAALGYAHRLEDDRGRALELVHRDVTPRNVLLNRRGQLKLVDFGIARAQFQLHVTRTGTVKGTLPYMSPEQAAGGDVDQRSDLYSVAVILYEMLIGAVAFPKGPSPTTPSGMEGGSDLPRRLAEFLRRATAFEHVERFASATEQSRALIEALGLVDPASREEVARWVEDVCPRTKTDVPAAPTSNASDTLEDETDRAPEEVATVIDARKRK